MTALASIRRRKLGRLLPREAGKRFAGFIASGLNCVFDSRAGGRPGILVYHRIADPVPGLAPPTINVPPRRFRLQMTGLLNRGFRPSSLGELLEHHRRGTPVPPKSFVVTFDDCFENVLTEAWPVLRECRIPATLFVSTAFLGQEEPFPFDTWGRNNSGRAGPETYRPLTIAQCREMAASGLIEIAAHTHTHADFRGRPDEFERDLRTSVEFIRDHFERPCVSFAFPFGRKSMGYVNAEMIDAARRAGASCALTTEAEVVDPTTDPFGWGRFNAYSWDSAATLAAKLNAWYGWAPRLQERLKRGRA
ncbi:MAG: polysaccharide deacetylase family protein [Gemmataceae bacterium]